jgi:predicted SprT family Zn-dependent metalloprotease
MERERQMTYDFKCECGATQSINTSHTEITGLNVLCKKCKEKMYRDYNITPVHLRGQGWTAHKACQN